MMNLDGKNNLSQILRQHESSLNIGQTDQSGQMTSSKPFSLRSTATPFVVDNKFALQLDEVI
jgi:hypothetical protein